MDPAQLSHVIPYISFVRLGPYLDACQADTEKALRLYTWNIEISAAFFGPLHVLEVAMRNSMQSQLSEHFDRSDWWRHPKAPLNQPLRQQIQRMETRSIKSARRQNRKMIPDDLVPNLGFSFWIGLLSKGGKLQFETRYWQPCLRRAFPHFQGSRGDLYSDFDYLRTFRNRIAHHEPIFYRHLESDYESILRVTSFIDLDTAKFADSQSRVPVVLAKHNRVVENGFSSSF